MLPLCMLVDENVQMLDEKSAPGFPGAHEAERTHATQHCALWVYTGTATVRSPGGVVEFGSGECLVVPAGVPYEITVHVGSLVIPVLIPEWAVADLSAPVVIAVDASWNAWILHHFAAWVSPMRSPGYTGDELLAELDRRDDQPEAPVCPTSSLAGGIARHLWRFPADPRLLRDLASAVGISVQSLRRAFLKETGMTPGAWRTAMRLHAAREYLLAGYPVSWAADRVGFASSHGFIRAFSDRFGQTPACWAQGHNAVGDGERASEERRTTRFADALTGGTSTARTAPPIPASVAARRTYRDTHVVLWMYRGTARVSVDDRHIELSDGDAVWMPAGHSHEVMVDDGAVALPMAFPADLLDVRGDDVVVTRVPSTWQAFMLHNVVSSVTLLRPEGYDPAEVLEVFGGLVQRRRDIEDAALMMPVTPAARLIAQKTLDDLAGRTTTPQWAEDVGVSSRTVNRWFREETGRGYGRWRRIARVRRAMELLDQGVAPSATARRVGYTHLSAFSRDFREEAGMSPREFVRRPPR